MITTLALAFGLAGTSSVAGAHADAAHAPPRFHCTLLRDPPDVQSKAVAVNERGETVGSVGNGFENFSVFWATPAALPVIATGPGADFSIAMDINAAGIVVGSAMEGAAAYTWQPGNDLEWLQTLGACCPMASAINDRGVIVGFSTFPNTGELATHWKHGVPQNLGVVPGDFGSQVNDVSETGRLVGVSGVRAAAWASVGAPAVRLELAGATHSYAYEVNDVGDAVGEAYMGGPGRAILWPRGGPGIVLPTLGGNFGAASAINDHSWIVGMSQAVPSGFDLQIRATLWLGGKAFDLNELALDVPPDVRLVWASDVNDAGQIVGTAFVAGLEHAFFLEPVPATPWIDVGHARASLANPPALPVSPPAPVLGIAGTLRAGEPVTLVLSGAPEASATWIVLQLVEDEPRAVDELAAAPHVVLDGLRTDAAGNLEITAPWPEGLLAGFTLIAQSWTIDAAAPQLPSPSNTLQRAIR